jgi:transcriptional regulator with XRE-family HTH domain
MATRIEPFYGELGSRIRRVRESKSVSQAALGRQLHPPVTRASIANIENAKQRVLSHTLVDIAAVLEVGVADLLPIEKRESSTRVRAESIEQELVQELGKEQAAMVSRTLADARRPG